MDALGFVGIGGGAVTRRVGRRCMVMKPDRVDSKAMASDSGMSEPAGFWKGVDEAMWDFLYGWKEKRWSPKKSGGNFDRRKSTLSWGREHSVISPHELSEEFLASLGSLEEPAPAEEAACEVPPCVVSETMYGRGPDAEKLNNAIERMADWCDVPSDQEMRVLDGRTLAELCFNKYGKYHDMDIFQAQPFGSANRQVAVNFYYASLGDSNFPYSEEDYLSKLNHVTDLLNAVDQAWYIRKFLAEPIKPRRGLPSTPRWDTAVTVRLNTSPTWRYVSPEVVEQFFSW